MRATLADLCEGFGAERATRDASTRAPVAITDRFEPARPHPGGRRQTSQPRAAGRVHDREAGEEAADRVAGREPPGRGGRRSASPRRRPGARRRRRRRRTARRARRSRSSRRSRRRGSPARPRSRRAPTSVGSGIRAAASPSSASGAAMPRPSVMLWIMKPTIRNVPSVSSPSAERRADREALAEVVQADADGDERREREAARPCRCRRDVARGETNVIVRKLSATPSSTRPGPPSVPGSAAWSANASNSASTPRNVSRPAVSAMNAASHFASARRSDGSQSRPSAIGSDADEEADDRVAEEAAAPTASASRPRPAISFTRLDAGRARDADRDRVVLDPVVRDDDRARAQPAELARAVERERHDRVVDA